MWLFMRAGQSRRRGLKQEPTLLIGSSCYNVFKPKLGQFKWCEAALQRQRWKHWFHSRLCEAFLIVSIHKSFHSKFCARFGKFLHTHKVINFRDPGWTFVLWATIQRVEEVMQAVVIRRKFSWAMAWHRLYSLNVTLPLFFCFCITDAHEPVEICHFTVNVQHLRINLHFVVLTGPMLPALCHTRCNERVQQMHNPYKCF